MVRSGRGPLITATLMWKKAKVPDHFHFSWGRRHANRSRLQNLKERSWKTLPHPGHPQQLPWKAGSPHRSLGSLPPSPPSVGCRAPHGGLEEAYAASIPGIPEPRCQMQPDQTPPLPRPRGPGQAESPLQGPRGVCWRTSSRNFLPSTKPGDGLWPLEGGKPTLQELKSNIGREVSSWGFYPHEGNLATVYWGT